MAYHTQQTELPAFGRKVRHLWSLDPAVTFLNYGSFGATPVAVQAAQTEWRRQLELQPVAFMETALPGALRSSAERLARTLGARGQDLVFVDNATTGMNIVLRSARLSAGDEVVTLSHAYPAVKKALAFICKRRGAVLREVELPFPFLSSDDVLGRFSDALGPRTRLAVIDHITSHSAAILPVREMTALCRDKGIQTLVDGAHAPGMVAVDLSDINADWYTANCHKWIAAPKGSAFLWAREDVQAGLDPLVISLRHGNSWADGFDWTGTNDPTAHLSVPAALDFWEAPGMVAASAYRVRLISEAAEMLAQTWGTEIGTPADMTGAMACLRLPTQAEATLEKAHHTHMQLREAYAIEIPVFPLAGHLWIRISAQIFNEMADYDRLVEALPKL